MKIIPILLIIFWAVVIANPDILAYLIGGFFVFVGVNILLINYQFGKIKKNAKEGKKSYIKFGDYEIYR